jgi:uncharacterized protein (DUF58 family)
MRSGARPCPSDAARPPPSRRSEGALTARGRAVLALGGLCWMAAVVFGSTALYPVAAGLVLAVPFALAWVRCSRRSLRLSRSWSHDRLLEGDEVEIEVVVKRDAPRALPLPAAVASDVAGSLGLHEVELRPRRRGYTGSYRLRGVPRGRHSFGALRLSLCDPFGLAATELTLAEPDALVVYPRLVELERCFFAGGSIEHGRRLLRRVVGFELHGVREHERGESLRRVHWPSTAHRGQLMVKELEDSPRDEVAVLLDGDAAAVAGQPPGSSFDAAVRAAGSIVLAQARRGRRCLLVVNSARRETHAVSSEGADWRQALELLAAAEPDATSPVAHLLTPGAGAALRARELVVVTSRLEPALVERLLERALCHRPAALVHVDGASFAGRPSPPEPALLRLAAAGVPVAVVRHGEDLAAALEGHARPPASATWGTRPAEAAGA